MSEPLILSPEQRAVVEAISPRLNVVAAAGAGKTAVLAERYIRHVTVDGHRPDAILTITFTKKAAAEMKERIVRKLRALGRFADAQIAETGPIQTLHSFCERLLRENALAAGLDPQFEILGESHATRLVYACIREALESISEEAPQAEDLLRFLLGRPQWGNKSSPYAMLESSVSAILSELRSCGIPKDRILAWHADPRVLEERWEQALLEELDPELREEVLTRQGLTFADAARAALRNRKLTVPPWLRPTTTTPESEALARSYACGLVQLAMAAAWRLEREMHRMQALDFTALEDRAVQLLMRSPATVERLQSQYAVVMIDEAQDLNPVQYRLLDQLSPTSMMLVGDGQQSIYGFRQADLSLFGQRVAESESKRLRRNFRSAPGILSFVDFIFGNLWGESYTPMSPPPTGDLLDQAPRSFDGVEIWRLPSKGMDLVATNITQVHGEGVPYRDITVLVRDAGGAKETEQALRAAGVPFRVAGGSERFYARLEVRDLANILRAAADPADEFSLLACLRSPIVGLSLDSIVLLAACEGWSEQLAEFEPPVPEDVERLQRFLAWFHPLRQIADRLSAWEVLAEVFAKSDLLTTLARRPDGHAMLANVRKLLALATKEPELGPIEYAERIREIQGFRHKEGDAPADEANADVVTVMTIHKAKGLEFPVVILPQTAKRLSGPPRALQVEPRRGLVAANFEKADSTMHRFLANQAKARDEAEELRVLYVAMTRAKSRLCICLYPSSSDTTASKIITKALGAATNGIRFRESSPDAGAPDL